MLVSVVLGRIEELVPQMPSVEPHSLQEPWLTGLRQSLPCLSWKGISLPLERAIFRFVFLLLPATLGTHSRQNNCFLDSLTQDRRKHHLILTSWRVRFDHGPQTKQYGLLGLEGTVQVTKLSFWPREQGLQFLSQRLSIWDSICSNSQLRTLRKSNKPSDLRLQTGWKMKRIS